jgi:glycosyltransferase involved in cell wall biosynthesis
MSRPASVLHVGPDVAYVGGIGSVIAVLVAHTIGSETVKTTPSWQPGAALWGLVPAVRTGARLMRGDRDEVVHIHLSERGSFVREGALVLISRVLGRPTVATIHGSSFLKFGESHQRLVGRVLRAAHVVTCLDSDVLALVRHLAPASQAEIVPNPVQIDEGSATADETEELVLFAGEISLRKGADVLWHAWQLVLAERPDARCLMVGPTRDYSPPPAERLEVRGPVPSSEVKMLLRRSRVVALPSRAEGMPMILTEAMAAGRPFVSTPVGGICELASAGGRLVETGDELSLAHELTGLLRDSALARDLGESGRRFCRATRATMVADKRFGSIYEAASCAARVRARK